jgi:hypothetical protein
MYALTSSLVRPRLLTVLSLCLFGLAAMAGAQPPRQLPPSSRANPGVPSRVDPQVLARARDACDAAATRAGYRVVRRDRESIDGRAYQLPMHVAHGTTEGDVTCRYDMDHARADVPPYAGGRGFGRGVDAQYGQVQTLCENYVNSKPNRRVIQVGTPVRQGRNLWDVPVTVQRNGRRQQTVTCRYNAASNKLSLR